LKYNELLYGPQNRVFTNWPIVLSYENIEILF